MNRGSAKAILFAVIAIAIIVIVVMYMTEIATIVSNLIEMLVEKSSKD